ncbi:hypothetical protein SUGI_0378660 [Cryptomeria japonica]|nr:hypothetical protein SUGI_0378660 [Cryptomeria japonica]
MNILIPDFWQGYIDVKDENEQEEPSLKDTVVNNIKKQNDSKEKTKKEERIRLKETLATIQDTQKEFLFGFEENATSWCSSNMDIDLAGRWSDVAKDKNLVIHCKAYMCNRLGSQTAHCEGSVKDSPIMNIQLRLQDPNINTPFEWSA